MAGDEPAAKKATAYNYFASSIDHSVPAAKPKLLSEAEVAEQQKLLSQQGEAGASAWNYAGTFEERSWMEMGKDFLKTALVGSSCGPITVKELQEITGSANTWIVRGKRRHGFDFEIKLSWLYADNGKELQGVASFPNAASDELDELHCELQGKDNEKSNLDPAVSKQIRGALIPHVSRVLKELLQELQKK
mmetsp:Transcript_2528/g.6449  ORF Transcript_2528/g.6449 Transcript_2528/m.6449 type:complete len:191 (-) Transcript_2528:636-1208(-)|eukprot:CAMPEP_0202353912 /NCGR_PEP_ID=MMETSP1126-20121109/9465_1 /ASSEMBLY_ACC=CAM_ASM_000457 /TAXON_ID=3047 /ORGANISM="Dunaliella tertiolecta, Strain CCMP1320" /LENGTH=190 /DNA_ID=CAMNT_0048946319 /DNA_START=24 /DNA_END=596 /DNA_ORIENTATION=+